MFPTTTVFYDIEKLKLLNEGCIESPPGRLVWFKDKPDLISGMDKGIRKAFKIEDKFKMVFTLYKPPQDGVKEPELTKSSKKLIQRVVLSTIHESPKLNLGHSKTQQFKMTRGEAYSIPFPINKMISIQFDDSPTLIIPAKKGFRQQRRPKRVEKRYIMVFDYIYTDEIQEAVEELAASC